MYPSLKKKVVFSYPPRTPTSKKNFNYIDVQVVQCLFTLSEKYDQSKQ